MRASTVLVLGGLGVIGYFIYRSLQSATPSAAVNAGIPAGLQAQIDAGSYNAQGLRMGVQPINYGAGYTGIA